jgi:hypothetical protein
LGGADSVQARCKVVAVKVHPVHVRVGDPPQQQLNIFCLVRVDG